MLVAIRALQIDPPVTNAERLGRVLSISQAPCDRLVAPLGEDRLVNVAVFSQEPPLVADQVERRLVIAVV